MLKSIFILGIIVLLAGIGLFVAGSVPQTESYVETKRTTWQVEWRTITGDLKWGASVGYSTFPATFTYNWDMGKVYGEYSDYIGFTATATIYVPRSGPVSFTLGSDDGARLYLDGTLIIDLWGAHYYTEKSAVIYLNPGKYTLTLYYYDITGYAKVSFYTDPDVLTWTETIEKTFVDSRLQILGLVIAGMGAAFTVVGISLITRRRPAS
jgi:hypothetical protein